MAYRPSRSQRRSRCNHSVDVCVEENGELLDIDDSLLIERVIESLAVKPDHGGNILKALRAGAGSDRLQRHPSIFLKSPDGLRRDDRIGLGPNLGREGSITLPNPPGLISLGVHRGSPERAMS